MGRDDCDLFEDAKQSDNWLQSCGVVDLERGRINLRRIAKAGLTADLVRVVTSQLEPALKRVGDPDRALNNFERFINSSRSPLGLGSLFERDDTALPILITLFSDSQFLSDFLVGEPEAFDAMRQDEGRVVSKTDCMERARDILRQVSSIKQASQQLVRFKHREMLRIVFCDLVLNQKLEFVSRLISELADAICQASFEFCYRKLVDKRGNPTLVDSAPCRFGIFAMGKLGGNELNYSSDIDLLMVYEGNGKCDGPGQISNKEFFTTLVQDFTRILSQETDNGTVYRVDLRLRPDGSRGPVCSHLGQLLNYYELRGRTWERQALIKLRQVAGDIEFGTRVQDGLHSWIYQHRLNRIDISEIKFLKKKIERTVSTRGHDHTNIKTGHGGIRDIEFTIQFLQLLHGGTEKQLRGGNTLQAIEKLQFNGSLTLQEETRLSQNYCWLRKLEHRLQIMFDLQTHRIPSSKPEIKKLAKRMGYPGPNEVDLFFADLEEVTSTNRSILNHLLHEAFPSQSRLESGAIDLVLDHNLNEEQVKTLLTPYLFQDAEKAYQQIQELADEQSPFLSSQRCRHFFAAIVDPLLAELATTPNPDDALTRLARVSSAIGGKASLWELFFVQPAALRLFVRMCSVGIYLSEILTRNPGMLDELIDSLALEALPGKTDLQLQLEELVSGAEDIQPILFSFKQAQHLQVGIRDLQHRDPIELKHQTLSDTAEVILAAAVTTSLERLCQKFGEPCLNGQARPCELVVLALGKLGGCEPNYHSDLDVIFLYEEDGKTNGSQATSNQHFFSQLATEVIKQINHSEPFGKIYDLDCRLRPTGKSGAMAVSFSAFQNYFDSGSGQLWERMALCKARPVFGSQSQRQRLMDVVHQICFNSQVEPDIEAIRKMRKRLEEGASPDNLKRSQGGTVDVEFAVQYLQLKRGHQYQAIRLQNTVQAIESMKRVGVLSVEWADELANGYRFLRRVESGIRLMNNVARHDLPASGSELQKLSFLLGSSSPSQLIDQIGSVRKSLRKLFDLILPSGS